MNLGPQSFPLLQEESSVNLAKMDEMIYFFRVADLVLDFTNQELILTPYHKKILQSGGDVMSVNLGNDADTTGAVYGQIAGTYYGYQGIPEEWRNKIALKEKIENYAEKLFQFSGE